MAQTLARVAAANPALNALVSLRPEAEVMAEARAADADPQGPLSGVPIAVKDLADTAGLRTTYGSPLFAEHVPKADGAVAARLRRAGAVIIGKTNTPEWGLGSHSKNPVFGVTRNPYALDRTAGGSSGGAAAALAAGILEIADGSDMMGSLRNPAGFCNCYGFRPTWGLVMEEPVGDSYLHQLATSGPMARTPAGLAQLLDVLAVADPRHPFSREPEGYAQALDTPWTPGPIGWLGDWDGAYGMEPGILAVCEAALARFGPVAPVPAPFEAARIWQSWIDLRSFAVAAKMAPLFAQAEKRAGLNPAAIWEIERGLALTALQVHAASEVRSAWFRAAMALFETHRFLALPTAQVWPFPAEWDWPEQINGVAMDTYHRWMEVVVPVSLLGLPSVALPAGFGPGGLPMGVQIFGAPGADAGLLRLAEAWHRATGGPEALAEAAGVTLAV